MSPPADPPLFDLFGQPIASPQPAGGPVRPAPVPVALREMAARLPGEIRLGTSSWSFPGWDGLVYAGRHAESKLAREGLGAYAAHPLLRTVSLDRTFYAPLGERDYADYANRVPPGFRFIVKAPMAITSSELRDDRGRYTPSPYHFDAAYATDQFIAPAVAGLSDHCGPLVFQFPPQGRDVTVRPDPFINRLYRFLTSLPPGLSYAVELRDPQLLTTRFFQCLAASECAFCVASHARMPTPAEQIDRMQVFLPHQPLIVRWSLHAGYKYEDAKARYFPFDRLVDEDHDSRVALAVAAARAAKAGRAAYIAVNNKAEGSAPLSVEKLAAAIVASVA